MVKKSKVVKAWAVTKFNKRIYPYGNGKQFQYPIFFTRKEANQFKHEQVDFESLEILCVEIREVTQ